MLVFYRFIVKLNIKSYQWFCFVLLIYFLSSSLRVFGTIPYWLDIVELIQIILNDQGFNEQGDINFDGGNNILDIIDLIALII